MTARETHRAAVVALAEQIQPLLQEQPCGISMPALLLLVRMLMASLPDDAQPLSVRILGALIPEVLMACEPDEDGFDLPAGSTVQ